MNRILDAGPGGFEGGMSTEKYGHLVRVSRATAYRDLEELVRHGLLNQAGVGRGNKYFAAMEGWNAGTPPLFATKYGMQLCCKFAKQQQKQLRIG